MVQVKLLSMELAANISSTISDPLAHVSVDSLGFSTHRNAPC